MRLSEAVEPIDFSDEQSLDADLHRIEEPVRVGRYRLCYELGAGGMATVFLARAEGPAGFAKPVAIKRIHPHMARRKDLVEMFLDEARIASLISHPNVCSTIDFGEADGSYFLAMEYLVGEPFSLLQRRVGRAPGLLASERWQRVCTKIIADIGEGLHAAHELKDERGRSLNVIHRDVSPQNAFVTYDGVAKVVDFGVAFASDRITRTVTGGIKGKLGYLAPEQLLRLPYDRRVDVWALGIVLWEGLTGQRLFLSRSEVDTLLAIQHRVIPPPSQVVPGLSPELDAVVLKALSRDPEARYPTARAMSRDLVAYLGKSGAPITNVEVSELVLEVCADRRDVRAEVVASVMEDRPPTATAHPEALYEAATEVRAKASPPPVPKAAREGSHAGTAATYAGIARLSLVLMAGVAVLAIFVVAYRPVREEPADVTSIALPLAGTSTPLVTPPTPPAVPALAEPTGPVPTVIAPEAPTALGVPTAEAVEPPIGTSTTATGTEGTSTEGTDRSAGTGTIATPSRPRGRGSVAVTSPIAVEVCYRSECRWTPTVFADLPSGRASLSFRARDGRNWSRSVTVPSGGTTRFTASMPE